MNMRSTSSARRPGRPRSGVNDVVFAATLSTVHELGYARATVERIAAAAGVAKTTIYRRWPSKGALIVDCLLDAIGPAHPHGRTKTPTAHRAHLGAPRVGRVVFVLHDGLPRRPRAAGGARPHVESPGSQPVDAVVDVANRRRRWAIFVHGCFWHHHEGCKRATVPKRNRAFWLEKFTANRQRDRRCENALKESGFRVLTIWECQAEHEEQLRMLLTPLLK